MPELRDPVGNEPTTYNLLFVCSGNTCRSPLAAALAARAVRERAWNHVSVRSAGTSASSGTPASENAVLVAAEHELDLAGHRSTLLTPELLDWADLVLVMSPSHHYVVAELGGGEKAALLTDFLDGAGFGEPVEDPYGGEPETYRRAFRQIEQAVDALLAKLEPILSP